MQRDAPVLLTAGHCTSGAATAQVWFDAAIGLSSPSFTGVPHTHPDFSESAFPNRRDVGVVVFVVAVDSFVMNSNCTGSGFAYRTDIADAQSFILPFVGS
jgi:hypothetical protein